MPVSSVTRWVSPREVQSHDHLQAVALYDHPIDHQPYQFGPFVMVHGVDALNQLVGCGYKVVQPLQYLGVVLAVDGEPVDLCGVMLQALIHTLHLQEQLRVGDEPLLVLDQNAAAFSIDPSQLRPG